MSKFPTVEDNSDNRQKELSEATANGGDTGRPASSLASRLESRVDVFLSFTKKEQEHVDRPDEEIKTSAGKATEKAAQLNAILFKIRSHFGAMPEYPRSSHHTNAGHAVFASPDLGSGAGASADMLAYLHELTFNIPKSRRRSMLSMFAVRSC